MTILRVLVLSSLAAAGCHDSKPSTGGTPTPVGVVAAARRLGPIDLAAAELDLDARFPGTQIALRAGQPEVVTVTKAGEVVAELELSERWVTKVTTVHPSMVTTAGIAVGSTAEEMAQRGAGIQCWQDDGQPVWCQDAQEEAIWYELDASAKVATSEGSSIAVVTPTARVTRVRWAVPGDLRPQIVRKPAS